jgi:hypothetical protein
VASGADRALLLTPPIAALGALTSLVWSRGAFRASGYGELAKLMVFTVQPSACPSSARSVSARRRGTPYVLIVHAALSLDAIEKLVKQ